MNRSFFNVILGGFGSTEQTTDKLNKEQKPVKSGNADDAAFDEKCIFGNNCSWLRYGCCSSSTCFKRNG